MFALAGLSAGAHATTERRLGAASGGSVDRPLTMTVKLSGTGSKIVWDYVVGGYARMPLKELAPVVDGVISEQLGALALLLKSSRPPLKGHPAHDIPGGILTSR